MRSRSLFVAILLSLAALPLFAQSNEVAGYVSTVRVGSYSGTTDVHFDDGHGYGASVSHVFGDHLGIEVGANWIRNDAAIRSAGTTVIGLGRLETSIYSGIVQWRFGTRNAFVDPYVGAGVAFVSAKDLSSEDLTTAGIGNISLDNKTTYVAQAGVNLNFSHSLAIVVDGKYVKYEPDTSTTPSLKLNLNPVIVSAGLRFRF
jgi:outer membrane protein W